MQFSEYLEIEPLWRKGVELVSSSGNAGISHLQRHLMIGYNRAARMLEMMESQKIVGPMKPDGKRKLLSAATAAGEG